MIKKAQKVKRMTLPHLTKQKIVTVYSQLRPYRQGGYRIELEKYQSKNIFHNYGQGGSGVSLSYGSAFKIVKLFEDTFLHYNQNKKQQVVAVIGCGIMGLTTALELAKKGYKVKIYTKHKPIFGEKDNDKMITSQIAPGFWMAYDYFDEKDSDVRTIAKISLEQFQKDYAEKRFKAMKKVYMYDKTFQDEVFYSFSDTLPKDEQFIYEKVDWGNGQSQQYRRFASFRIDMQFWIKELMELLYSFNVEIVQKNFTKKQEILNLPQTQVFNCTGFGAKQLFKDQNVKGFKGHLVEFQNPNPQILDYFFGQKLQSGHVLRVYCHQSRIIFGYTRQELEDTKVDMKIVQNLLKEYQLFYKKWTQPKPSL